MSRVVQVKTLKGETFSIDVAEEALVRACSGYFAAVCTFVLLPKRYLLCCPGLTLFRPLTNTAGTTVV